MSPSALLRDPRIPKWFLSTIAIVLASFSVWAAGQLWAGANQDVVFLSSNMKALDTRTIEQGERIKGLEATLQTHVTNQFEESRRINQQLERIMESLMRIERRTR